RVCVMAGQYCLRSLALIVLSAIVAAPILAQTATTKTTLRGKVLDPNRAAIPGAEVWISAAGFSSTAATTDRNGEFAVTLHPGQYQVRIVADGFSEATQIINLAGNNPQTLEVVLSVGPSTASVTITDI